MSTNTIQDLFRPYDYDHTVEFSLSGYQGWARVVNVYDGDSPTIVLKYNNSFYRFSTRMYGIDTMEMTSKDPEIKQKALLAKFRLIELISGQVLPQSTSKADIKKFFSDNVFIVWVECLEMDKYGRVLHKMKRTNTDPETFNDILVKDNLALPYFGGTKSLSL